MALTRRCEGKLSIHGETKEIESTATITIKTERSVPLLVSISFSLIINRDFRHWLKIRYQTVYL
jgi:hypothetical protein